MSDLRTIVKTFVDEYKKTPAKVKVCRRFQPQGCSAPQVCARTQCAVCRAALVAAACCHLVGCSTVRSA